MNIANGIPNLFLKYNLKNTKFYELFSHKNKKEKENT